MSDPFQWLDATEQAKLVATGEVSAKELVGAAISRMEKLEPRINATTSLRYEKAIKEAGAADKQPVEQKGPFSGVPYLVKDLHALAGEPRTLGSNLFKGHRDFFSEPLIKAANSAGLIALGKTTTSEFGLLPSTEPLIHSPTLNPWNTNYGSGGSSGGSAAAVASGMVPIAQASDGGGSIRIPAARCGLVGLKPSRGRGLKLPVDATGEISVAHCVSRSVRDTAKFLEISDAARVRKKQPGAPDTIGFVKGHPTQTYRIAVAMKPLAGAEAEPETVAAVESAAKLCEDLGHHVEMAKLPVDESQDMESFFAPLIGSVAINLQRYFHLIRLFIQGPAFWSWPSYDEALEPWMRGLAEIIKRKNRDGEWLVKEALEYQKKSLVDFAEFFKRYDFILSPVVSRPKLVFGEIAPTVPAEVLLKRAADHIGYTAMYNFTGLPALSLPLGTASSGVPIGVQFGASLYDEAKLLHLAYQIEDAAPWAQRRPPQCDV